MPSPRPAPPARAAAATPGVTLARPVGAGCRGKAESLRQGSPRSLIRSKISGGGPLTSYTTTGHVADGDGNSPRPEVVRDENDRLRPFTVVGRLL